MPLREPTPFERWLPASVRTAWLSQHKLNRRANLLRCSGACAGALLIYASLRWHKSIILLVLGEILFCAFFIFPDLAWGLERALCRLRQSKTR
jgi:hypothetical protein